MFGPEFFPTPRHVGHKMLARLQNKEARNFLEPQAGKGDLAEVIRGEERYERRKVDCIELHPELGSVLLAKGFPLVGYDWLTFNGVCYYDAIVMNPPFSNGAEHLLKAWDFMHDGEIVCLLNEETVNNLYSAQRQRLSKLIEHHGSVEYLGDCFSTALRKTDVNVALVYLKKEAEDDRIDLWASETNEREVNDDIGSEPNLPAILDQLGNMQHYYDCANEHMMKAFQHIRKAALYMEANGVKDRDYKEIMPLAMENINSARAEFVRKHRRDAWMKVFGKMQFRKWLDKKQTDEFIREIETNSNIQFTKENINGTLENVFFQRKKLFQKSVANVFDELTRYYNGNTNHTEGWKTNDSYKVNRKLVFPWGCEWDTIFNKFNLRWGRSCIDIYNDLDRIMCVLDGEDFEQCVTIEKALNYAFQTPDYAAAKKTASKYFRIWFFKKGTVHLEFKDEKLWERFNVEASTGKRWIGENTKSK